MLSILYRKPWVCDRILCGQHRKSCKRLIRKWMLRRRMLGQKAKERKKVSSNVVIVRLVVTTYLASTKTQLVLVLLQCNYPNRANITRISQMRTKTVSLRFIVKISKLTPQRSPEHHQPNPSWKKTRSCQSEKTKTKQAKLTKSTPLAMTQNMISLFQRK